MDQLADDKNENENSDLSNFGVLRERVKNIDKRLGELVEGVANLDKTIHEAAKTKWGELIGFSTIICLVLGALWLIIIIPIKEDIKDLKNGTTSVRDESAREQSVDKEFLRLENDLKDKVGKDEFNRLIIDIDKRLGRK